MRVDLGVVVHFWKHSLPLQNLQQPRNLVLGLSKEQIVQQCTAYNHVKDKTDVQVGDSKKLPKTLKCRKHSRLRYAP
jgi:hypothetical protein